MKKNENRPQDIRRTPDTQDTTRRETTDQSQKREPSGQIKPGSQATRTHQDTRNTEDTRTRAQDTPTPRRENPGVRTDASGQQSERAAGGLEQKLQGNWNVIKQRLQQEYADLTPEDLRYTKGQEAEFLSRIQKNTGMNRDQFRDWVDSQVGADE